MDPVTREKMGKQAIDLAKACGYYSTGTVEFLVDINKDFYFLEMNTRLQVEHPITEEITGVNLVEQQLLVAAGYPLSFGQKDIQINGHSVEYRVYAEDPSRKFLPSIGHLRKYKEPETTSVFPLWDEPVKAKRIRIDTGVQEGSEISMYYDPMISKLVTWGKDRNEAMALQDRAYDEYVIRGVTHNLGFGKSIVANEDFYKGDYSTGFIEKFYPEGFTGDNLNAHDHSLLSVVGHQIKNIHSSYGKSSSNSTETLYVRVERLRDQPASDYKITRVSDSEYTITNMSSGETESHSVDEFKFDYNSLVTMNLNGEAEILQFDRAQNDNIQYWFSYKGNNLKLSVYDERQYQFVQHMPEPVVIDHAKSIISPMPGAVVSVLVKPGDKVVAGQQLAIIEAMKMQNVLKAERDGEVEAVNVKAGDSVAVDELLIQFK